MRLQDTCYISAIDLKDAFWQIPLENGSQEKTAFTVPGRPLYHFRVMPFGLCNAPQTMMRLMDRVIPSELREIVFVYLDDLLVFSKNFEDHIVLLKKVAECLAKSGLNINVTKSKFCMKEVNYLGFVVGGGSIRTSDERVEAIRNFKIPQTVREVRQFLGVANYYRKFVHNFSSLASPISDLIKKGKKFEMTEEALEAISNLKRSLTTAPVLVHPDYSRPFIVQCDASNSGIGAVLCQIDAEGFERPIYFYSRKLNKSQKNYSVTELECLAAVYAIKKFRPYLEMQPFTVITDHSSLKWLMCQKDLSGRLARWSLSLQGYDFEIEHRKGLENVIPDALSRSCTEGEIAELFECILEVDLNSVEFDCEDYRSLRQNCQDNSEFLPDIKVSGKFVYKRLGFTEGNSISDTLVWKLWVPNSLTENLIKSAHNPPQASHGGISKTLFRLREKYYWPNMAIQVRNYIGKCVTCKSTKAPNFITRPPMGRQTITEIPFLKIFIDLLGPYPRSKTGNTYILVVLDHFSKFCFIHP